MTMDARTAAAQPGATHVKRRLMSLPFEARQQQEIEVPADSSVLGLVQMGGMPALLVGVPEGSGPVRRKIWVITFNSDISIEAQNGDFVGEVMLSAPATDPSAAPTAFLAVVFIETQKQAIERATHRGTFRAPPAQ